jgi:hypothetical protein
MKQKEKSNDLSNNILDNSGDVESVQVTDKKLENSFSHDEKALEEVFWYRLRNKTGRISAGLENIGQDLANGFKLIENEVEDVQRDVKVHWEILSDKLAKFQVDLKSEVDQMHQYIDNAHNNHLELVRRVNLLESTINMLAKKEKK